MAKAKKAEAAKVEANCPITLEQFRAKAPGIVVADVNKVQVLVEKKEFSTGSFGWYFSGKIPVEIDGQVVKVQVSVSMQVVGSKELNNGKA